MGQEAAVRVQSGSMLRLMVPGVTAGVQLEHVLQLGVTAGGGALVKAIAGALMPFVIPRIPTATCPQGADAELSFRGRML